MSNMASSNPYSLSYEVRTDYLYVLIEGEQISSDIARSYWNNIISLSRKTNSKRMLVNKEIPLVLSPAKLFQLGSELAADGFQSCKVTICDRHATPDGMVFSENVIRNRGLNGRAFTELDEATNWLISSS